MSYWKQFVGFTHNAQAPIKKEFNRLARMKGWFGNSPEMKETRRNEWGKCFHSEFGKHYGEDASSLVGWQKLCEDVRLKDIPQSVVECERALKGKIWVNLVDLVDCRRTGKQVERHDSMEALRKYTKKTERVFCLEEAKENRFMTALLITIPGLPRDKRRRYNYRV